MLRDYESLPQLSQLLGWKCSQGCEWHFRLPFFPRTLPERQTLIAGYESDAEKSFAAHSPSCAAPTKPGRSKGLQGIKSVSTRQNAT